MRLRLSLCPYRLLFKHPFGTSHGTRDGTDAIFVRAEQQGMVGYGEVTLPPYVKEKPAEAVERLRSIALRRPTSAVELLNGLDSLPEFQDGANGCRAGLHMALIDLIGKIDHLTVKELLDIDDRSICTAVVTLGFSELSEVAAKLGELPLSGGLKVKVSGLEQLDVLRRIRELDPRPLLIDANQGMRSVEDAARLVVAIGREAILAFEQPFGTDVRNANRELHERCGVPVIADESVRTDDDLQAVGQFFGGVNLKLMKCGGLDRAKGMADEAYGAGLKVMLGSMSESSLGCSAMANLIGQAEIADLDGPWLLKNDPFIGLDLVDGRIARAEGSGVGAVLRAELNFIPIGT